MQGMTVLSLPSTVYFVEDKTTLPQETATTLEPNDIAAAKGWTLC